MNNRTASGSALLAAMAVSTITMMVALGTATLLMPSLRVMTSSRFSDVARSKAEAALDWSVQQLNDSATRGSIDGQTVAVPDSILGSSFTGTVKVENISAPTYSYLYDPLADITNADAGIAGGNGWRVITAKVSNGVYGKAVRVILKPMYQTNVTSSTETVTTTEPGASQAIFNNALFARNAITGVGNMTTNSYDPTQPQLGFANTDGDVGTNTGITLSGNVTIGGDLSIDSTPSGSTTTTVATGNGTNATVTGDITSNGLVSGITAGGSILQSATNPPEELPPVPTAPASATNLGSINLSGKQTLTISQPGDYIVNSITMAGQAQIKVTADGPVNIYVQGSGSNNGFSISGQGVLNSTGDPANLRVWYAGSGQINLTGQGSFVGVIYAPNATLNIPGQGELYGAAVANYVNLAGNGTFHYDRNLQTNQSLSWTPPVTKTATITTESTVENLQNFQVVSWAEL